MPPISSDPPGSALSGTGGIIEVFHRLDVRIVGWLRRWSLSVLRVALAAVFIWFGALKIFDVTPVSDLVGRVVYWLPEEFVVPALGVVEVLVGLGLLVRRLLRVVLALFFGQMLGTFLVFLVLPDVAFRDGNPLLLTVEGEFLIKNLVLLSAGLVVGSTVKTRGRAAPDTLRGLNRADTERA